MLVTFYWKAGQRGGKKVEREDLCSCVTQVGCSEIYYMQIFWYLVKLAIFIKASRQ